MKEFEQKFAKNAKKRKRIILLSSFHE